MTGNIRWNLFGGAVAFVLTFLVSITRNVLLTTLLRSFYSFVIVFAFLFLFRFILHLIINGPSAAAELAAGAEEPDVSDTGRNVDLATPNDDSLHDLLRANLNAGGSSDDGAVFTQLKPPKLISQSERDPEQLAKALRRMSEE
jgi:hypothetical protein